MDTVAMEYLKKVGVRVNVEKVVNIDETNYRFPTISCKLNDEEEGFVFSLNYFISDDFSKQSLEFTFEDWYNWKRRSDIGDECNFASVVRVVEKHLGFKFFNYFSITETLLTRVYQSRLKGRKAWKKRNFRLGLKKASTLKAFGIEGGSGRNDVSSVSVDNITLIEKIVELDEIMHKCVLRASQDFSYAPFDVYFDCYKKKLSLERKLSGADDVSARTNRDKVFKEFAKQVVLLQKNG